MAIIAIPFRVIRVFGNDWGDSFTFARNFLRLGPRGPGFLFIGRGTGLGNAVEKKGKNFIVFFRGAIKQHQKQENREELTTGSCNSRTHRH